MSTFRGSPRRPPNLTSDARVRSRRDRQTPTSTHCPRALEEPGSREKTPSVGRMIPALQFQTMVSSHGNTCARISRCAEAARTPARLSIRYRIFAAVQSQGCSFSSLGGRDPVHDKLTGDMTTSLRICTSSGLTVLTLRRSNDDTV